MSRETFDAAIKRIGREAIEASLAEIEVKFAEWVSQQDWWHPDPEDPFWMIEVRQGLDNAGAWVKNEHSGLTTRDPAKALRYPTEWSADCARKRLYPLDGQFHPTEHLWCNFPDAIPAGADHGKD